MVLRCSDHGVPVIYVNDNFWRSDFRSTVARCSDLSRPGAGLVRRLHATTADSSGLDFAQLA